MLLLATDYRHIIFNILSFVCFSPFHSSAFSNMNVSGSFKSPQTLDSENHGGNIGNIAHHNDISWRPHRSPLDTLPQGQLLSPQNENLTSPMASKLSHAHSSPCPTCSSPTRMIHRTNSTEGYEVNGQFSRLPPTKSIQEQLDNEVAKYSEPWLGSIPFKCGVVFGERGDPISHTPLQDIDICNYLNGGVFKAQRLYFCSSRYTPSGQGQVNEADS